MNGAPFRNRCRFRRRGCRTAIGGLLLSALALGACGGTASTFKSDGDSSGPAVFATATESANTARLSMRVAIAMPQNKSGEEAIDGVIDFKRGRGSAMISAKGSASAPDFGGPYEMRWIGSDAWFRFNFKGVLPADPGFGITEAKPWLKASSPRDSHDCANDNNFFGQLLGLPSFTGGPSDVLGALHQQGVTVTKIGTDTVRGSDTTHWRVDVASKPSTTIAADDCSADAAMHTLELWTDNEDRVRRIQAAGSEGGMISLKATTEFYDFGVPVDVNAPPASQVSDPSQSSSSVAGSNSQVQLPDLRPPASMPEVAHGILDGRAWTVQASNTKDTRCYATTGVPQSSSMLSSGMCVPIAALSFPGPWILANARSGSERLLIGAVDPKNGSVELTFADGRTVAAPVDSHTGLFTWSGSAATTIRTITVGTASCTLADATQAKAIGPCLGSNLFDGSGSTSGSIGSP